MDIDSLSKNFTRFFVPGLILVFIGFLLPIFLVLGLNPKEYIDLLSGINIIILSVLTGYILDAIRGYRLTPAYRKYSQAKKTLVKELTSIINNPHGTNPDDYLAELWIKDKLTYERLFRERAEWVMILETSFSTLVSAFFIILISIWKWSEIPLSKGVFLIALTLCLILISYVSSDNGIARMNAHDKKMIEAIRMISRLSNDAPPQTSPNQHRSVSPWQNYSGDGHSE